MVEDVAECGTVVEDGAEYGNRATVNIIVIVQQEAKKKSHPGFVFASKQMLEKFLLND